MNLTGSSRRKYHVLIAGVPAANSSLLLEFIENYLKPRLPEASFCVYEAKDGNEARAIAVERQASGHGLDLAVVEALMHGESVSDTIGSLLRVSPQIRIILLSATDYTALPRRLKEIYGNKLRVMQTCLLFSSHLDTFVETVERSLEGNHYA